LFCRVPIHPRAYDTPPTVPRAKCTFFAGTAGAVGADDRNEPRLLGRVLEFPGGAVGAAAGLTRWRRALASGDSDLDLDPDLDLERDLDLDRDLDAAVGLADDDKEPALSLLRLRLRDRPRRSW